MQTALEKSRLTDVVHRSVTDLEATATLNLVAREDDLHRISEGLPRVGSVGAAQGESIDVDSSTRLAYIDPVATAHASHIQVDVLEIEPQVLQRKEQKKKELPQ